MELKAMSIAELAREFADADEGYDGTSELQRYRRGQVSDELALRDDAVRKLVAASYEYLEAQRVAWDERPDDEQGTQKEWNAWGPIEERRDFAGEALRSAIAAFQEPVTR
jgi:hypothetical protein